MPLGIAYLGAAIGDICEVELLDATAEGYFNNLKVDSRTVQYGLTYADITRRVERFAPDMVGMTCLFSHQWPVVSEIAQRVKKLDKDIVVATGGTHPNYLAKECLEKERAIDFIFTGEGESSLKEFIVASKNGKSVYDINGIAFRDGGSGEVRINPAMPFIADIDSIPLPARDKLNMERYFEINYPHSTTTMSEKSSPIITSRGCSAKCIFCSSSKFWGYKYRMRSPESVLDELQMLKERWGIEEVRFEDDNLSLDPDRAKAILKGMIERRLNLKWSTPNGIALWTLDDEMLELMKEAGCYALTLAFESGDQYVLDNIIKKPLNLAKVEPLVKKMKELGIMTYSYFIVGFPGETFEQMKNTERFIGRLKLDHAVAFVATPLPGTVMYDKMKDMGMLPDDFNFEHGSFFLPNVKHLEARPEQIEAILKRILMRQRLRFLIKNPVGFMRKNARFFKVLYRNMRKTVEVGPEEITECRV